MKTLLFVAAIALLSGCITREKCQRRYPPEVITEVITETQIITRDTLIYITLPPEVVVHTDTVLIDQQTGLVNSRRSYLETSLAWSTAQVIDSRLHHELQQPDTTIEVRLKDALKTVDRLQRELSEKITTVEVEKPLTWWQQTMIRGGYLLLALIAGAVGYALLKIKLP
jgi:hypothetical protein